MELEDSDSAAGLNLPHLLSLLTLLEAANVKQRL